MTATKSTPETQAPVAGVHRDEDLVNVHVIWRGLLYGTPPMSLKVYASSVADTVALYEGMTDMAPIVIVEGEIPASDPVADDSAALKV